MLRLHSPTPERAADKVIARSHGCADSQRLFTTPQSEIELLLGHWPRKDYGVSWIDPRFSSVYVLANEANDLCKIGFANNLRSRLSSISGSSPVAVHVAHFVYVVGPPLSKWVEAQAHEGLKDCRVKGEWFRVSVEEAAQAIAMPIIHRGLLWWSEQDRQEIGKKAAKLHIRDLQKAA